MAKPNMLHNFFALTNMLHKLKLYGKYKRNDIYVILRLIKNWNKKKTNKKISPLYIELIKLNWLKCILESVFV